MKFKYLVLFAFIACITIFLSCKKDIKTDESIITICPPANGSHFAIPAASPVTGRIAGTVFNEYNQAVLGAEVLIGTNTYQTDDQGFFQTGQITLDKYVSTVTVIKTGYFRAIRSFSATASNNNISIKLTPKTLGGTVNSGTGGTVSLNNGSSVALQAYGFVVKSTGALYTGNVNVYTAYIDPTTLDFAATVPGSMMGKDSVNMYLLQSAGMIGVELESDNGVALQLATGKTAYIKSAIPSSLTAHAPQTIATWSLNEQGIWFKEGTAVKNGDFYEFEASHFSFWNCDSPVPAIYLTMHLQDQNNQPIPNALAKLTVIGNNTYWATSSGYTDSTGKVAGLVPADLALQLDLYTNPYNCTSPVATQNIGSLSQDTSITINLTISQFLTISGVLNDCNGQPIQSGAAAVQVACSHYTLPIVNGLYSISVPYCNIPQAVTVSMIDNATGAYAGPAGAPVSGTNVTVPTQIACAATQQYASFNVINYELEGTYTAGVPLTPDNYMRVIADVQIPGEYGLYVFTNNQVCSPIRFPDYNGNFTHTGLDTVYVPGIGRPIKSGSNSLTFRKITNIETDTPFNLNVGGTTPVADITPYCYSAVINGNYWINHQLYDWNNLVVFTVVINSPGNFTVTTPTINGMSFSNTELIACEDGQTNIGLYGSGTPLALGTYQFPVTINGVPTGCSFDINVIDQPPASFTFMGAPGQCSGATLSGTFQAGVPVSSQNTVTMQVNVSATGTYNISTNTVNGITFSTSGLWISGGNIYVTLQATGIPTAPGTYSFYPSGGSGQPCEFTVDIQ